MSTITSIVILIGEINKKFTAETLSARVHITRSTIKAEVFFNDETLSIGRSTGRVHYIERDEQAGKLLEVESKLKSILESGKP